MSVVQSKSRKNKGFLHCLERQKQDSVYIILGSERSFVFLCIINNMCGYRLAVHLCTNEQVMSEKLKILADFTGNY